MQYQQQSPRFANQDHQQQQEFPFYSKQNQQEDSRSDDMSDADCGDVDEMMVISEYTKQFSKPQQQATNMQTPNSNSNSKQQDNSYFAQRDSPQKQQQQTSNSYY